MEIQVEDALKKFRKNWKTVDKDKINYLMKYGIVQEVMRVEERKSVRREAANRPPPPVKEDTPEKKPGFPGFKTSNAP